MQCDTIKVTKSSKNSLVYTLIKLLPHIRYLNAIRYDKVNKIVQNLTLDGLLHA